MAKTPAQVGGHPIHAMLVPLPIGLFVFSFASDIAFQAGWGGPIWYDMAFYAMAAGVIGALLAALPGFIDFLAIMRGGVPAERNTGLIATAHMSLNLTIVALYAVNLYLRTRSAPEASLPLWLSAAAMLLLLGSGWLGGELAYVHGVGVTEPELPAPRVEVRPQPYSREAARR